MMKKSVLYAFIAAMLTAVSCTNDIPANVNGDTSGNTSEDTSGSGSGDLSGILVKFPLSPVLPLKRVLHNWEVMEAAVFRKEIR